RDFHVTGVQTCALPIYLHVRDPYIVADQPSRSYFLYKSAPVKDKQGADASGVVAYRSKDLEYWEGPYVVYATPQDNWIKGAIWEIGRASCRERVEISGG